MSRRVVIKAMPKSLLPWRVSDAHGLCIREDVPDGLMIADMSPQGSKTDPDRHWEGNREDAEHIVFLHNTFLKVRASLMIETQETEDEDERA